MSRCAWMLSGLLLACAPRACMPAAHASAFDAPAFRVAGVADGLPSSNVNAIGQDRAGFVWIATADGLARHDGAGFRVWRHDPADPASLPGNNIQALHVDAQDRVWLATEGGGLSVLDPQRRRFRHFDMATHPAIGSNDTWAIASRDGVLWFGTWGGGLHRLDRGGRIDRFMPVAGDAHSLPSANVTALAFDARGRLWIGTTAGLARWTGRGFERVPLPGTAPVPVVYALVADEGALWIATAAGLHRRMDDGHWRDPPWARRFARPAAALALARDRNGDWWIGSQDGLWRAGRDRDPLRVPLLQATATAASAAVLLDRDGDLWAALPGAGLGYLPARWRELGQLPTPGRAGGAGYRAVAPARAGGAWLADALGPPLRLDRAGNVQSLPASARRRLQGERVRAIAESDDGTAWVGSRERLWRIGTDGSVRAWQVGDRYGPPGPIDLLRTTADGRLWLSSAGNGVQLRAPGGRLLHAWRAGGAGLDGADVEALAVARDGGAWIAGAGGVSRLAPDGAAFVHVAEMGTARVYALAFDGDDVAWLSRPTGLERYRRQAHRWVRTALVGARSGVPAVEAAGLVVDARHRPWLATARGLYRWDPSTRQTRRIGVQDGLRSQEFVARGMALSRDGLLVATTTAGTVVLADTRAPPPAPVARVLALDELSIRDSGHWRELAGPAPRVPAGTRELRVRVRLPAYANPSATRYESWLQGEDRGWLAMDAGERVFASLPAGDYVLRLRATDADGNRSGERLLRWRVLPPWWRTPMALAGWTALAWLALSLVAVAARSRLRARRRMRWLEQGRTLAEQASRAKSRFLADLGHEVRTPMTGVLGMSDLLLDGSLAPAQRRQVEAIRSAGQHLLRLVDDALDLARIEAGRLVLDPRPLDLRALLAEVAALQAPLAHRRGLEFAAGIAPGTPAIVLGDALRIKQVLFNLLANAIKFTQQGEVGVLAEALPGGGLRLTVHDTGPGLDAAQRARLFGRFEQGDAGTTAQHGGFGLGLAISRELVLAMGGRIGVHAAAGGGTRFVVDLPLAAVQPRADNSCTASTSAPTCAGSMSGDMPWPRLNTCPSREPPLPAA